MMNANLTYWLFALVLLLSTVIIAIRGVQLVAQGKMEAHIKHMVLACNLLIFFVLSYVAKVFVLGREIKVAWSSLELAVLYTHESFILVMLVTGTWARILAKGFGTRLDAPTAADLVARTKHARLGKVALVSAACALITGLFVFYTLVVHA